jgi:hypothetical protein
MKLWAHELSWEKLEEKRLNLSKQYGRLEDLNSIQQRKELSAAAYS